MTAILQTPIYDFAKVRATNSTQSGGFASKVATATEPSGAGVLDMRQGGASRSYNSLLLVPYALADNNGTFSVRVWGWRLASDLWVPVLLCEVACTACAAVGVADKTVLNTERFADTLTLTYGNANVSVELLSPANDLTGHVLLDAKGFQYVEVIFNLTANVTSMNALYARM